MSTRIGAFKSNGAQLIIWQQSKGITFEFAKHYRDKKTREWRQSKIIFADELQGIADMFSRAAEWSKKHDCGEQLPKGVVHIDGALGTILDKIKERYETNTSVEK